MSEWLPIDTAPKDGTSVLLFWPAYAYTVGDEPQQVIAIGCWTENFRIASAKGRGESDPFLDRMSNAYWHDTDEADDYGLSLPEHAPTHWMPLPPAPARPITDFKISQSRNNVPVIVGNVVAGREL